MIGNPVQNEYLIEGSLEKNSQTGPLPVAVGNLLNQPIKQDLVPNNTQDNLMAQALISGG